MNTFKLYIPLIVHLNGEGEPFNTINEIPETDGACYVEDIKTAIEESMKFCSEGGLTDKMYGPQGMKIMTAIPDVEVQNHELVGVIKFESNYEFTPPLQGLLTFWTYEEMAGEWGTQFENTPIVVEDGELHVSFYNELEGYEILTEDEFFGRDDEQSQGMELS